MIWMQVCESWVAITLNKIKDSNEWWKEILYFQIENGILTSKFGIGDEFPFYLCTALDVIWSVPPLSILYWRIIIDCRLALHWGWAIGFPAAEHNKHSDHEIPDVSISFCLRLLDLPGANASMVEW